MKITPRSEFENIEGKWIILKEDALKEEYRTLRNRVRIATGGFGCRRDTIGTAVFTSDPLDPENEAEWERWERYHVEGVVDENEVRQLLENE